LVTEHRNSKNTANMTFDLSNCSKNVKYEMKQKWQEAGVTYLRLSKSSRFRNTALCIAIL
jgi:hypothetical protein